VQRVAWGRGLHGPVHDNSELVYNEWLDSQTRALWVEQEAAVVDWSDWLPAVIEDALAYHPKVLFLHPHMLVIDDLTVLAQMIDDDHPFFVGGVPTA
jgi:hypothetical protein